MIIYSCCCFRICDEITAELLAEQFFLSTFRFSRLWLGIDESVNVWYNKKIGGGRYESEKNSFYHFRFQQHERFCLCLREDWGDHESLFEKGYPDRMKLVFDTRKASVTQAASCNLIFWISSSQRLTRRCILTKRKKQQRC